MNYIHFWFVVVYSLMVRIFLVPAARMAAVASDRLDRQIHGRWISKDRVLELAKDRRRYEKCVVFFCSSAGEYEQAKPVIDRLQQNKVYTHVFFFSRSGFDFAKARNENSSFSLSPVDTIWNWGPLFAAIRPNSVAIVRHEFWPAFIWSASKWCPMTVIDAVPPAMIGREPTWKTNISALGKQLMLGSEAVAYTVDSSGTEYYRTKLHFSKKRLRQCGDTKYDRVVERVASMRPAALKKAQDLRFLWGDPDQLVLIVGSAHAADMDVILPAIALLPYKIRLLAVPHDLSSRNLTRISDQIRQSGRSIEMMSDVEVLQLDRQKTEVNTIMVDSMGRLSELYAAGDFAWVGGALHAKVHNVLEPAAWGLPIACGPNFKNSQEANHLVQAGVIQIGSDPKKVADIWLDQIANRDAYRKRLANELAKMCGASDLIARDFLAGHFAGESHA